MKRSELTAKFKIKVILEGLKEGLNDSELAKKINVTSEQVSIWRYEFLSKAEEVFLKGKSKSDKIKELDHVMGHSLLDSIEVQKEIQDYFRKYNKLTKRESQVLEFLVNGCTRKQISEKLFISAATVKTHCQNIYHKLGTSDRLILYKIYHAFL